MQRSKDKKMKAQSSQKKKREKYVGQNKNKALSNVVEVHPNISAITINVIRLNALIKRQRFSNGLKR